MRGCIDRYIDMNRAELFYDFVYTVKLERTEPQSQISNGIKFRHTYTNSRMYNMWWNTLHLQYLCRVLVRFKSIDATTV